jgi:hypothetical protein
MPTAIFLVASAIIVLRVCEFYILLMIDNVPTYVICETCDNFTLCIKCFMGKQYHHHPAHGFALKNPQLLESDAQREAIEQRLGPGRGMKHRAHCDECKQVIHQTINLT